LKELGIPPSQIRGYENTVRTHTECANLIQAGQVDAGIGLQAAARKLNLDFLPLFNERYDLTFRQEQSETLTPLLDHLQSGIFRSEVAGMSGYDTTHTGEQLFVM
jgi:putative molybdopterin biosynthesis protein